MVREDSINIAEKVELVVGEIFLVKHAGLYSLTARGVKKKQTQNKIGLRSENYNHQLANLALKSHETTLDQEYANESE